MHGNESGIKSTRGTPRLRSRARATSFPALDLASLIDAKIAQLYRFAVLLTGDAVAAERALLAVCTECAPHVEAFRTASNGMAFVISKLRARCGKKPDPPVGEPPEKISVAGQFHTLPEPGRSALALFYLDIFPSHEIAAMLHMSLEEFSAILVETRERLRALPSAA